LMLVGKGLKSINQQNKVGFFLHIPFPRQQHFGILPENQRKALIEGLLSYDLVGFHTSSDVNHFLDSVRATDPHADIEYPNKHTRRVVSYTTDENGKRVSRVTIVEPHPIGIDAKELKRQGDQPHVAEEANRIRENLPGQQILFDASRADYTKGIPDGMLALETAIEKYPDLIKDHVTFIQVMAPSRKGIPAYDKLWQDVINLAERVNTSHGSQTWKPVDLRTNGLNADGMRAHLRAAHVGYVKTLIDGWNLVAPEYITLAPPDGVLVLGKNAGAASLLKNAALLIDPTDHEATADTLQRALTMPQIQKDAMRQEGLRVVDSHNIHKWARDYWNAMRSIRAE